jgi:hypothetical protein
LVISYTPLIWLIVPMILLIFTFKMGNFLQSFQSFDIWPFKLYIY